MAGEMFGWLGHDKEREAYSYLKEIDEQIMSMYEDHIPTFIDFSQWMEQEQDIILPDIDWKFEFDSGFDFYEAVNRVFGQQIPPGPQSVGNCVPYGSCLSICDRYAVEILEYGESEEFWLPFVPYSYGAGRVYVGKVNWSSDGSLGAWQIEADMRHGILPTDTDGLPRKDSYDMQSTKAVNDEWKRQQGTLDKWKPKAIMYSVGSSTVIKSFEDCKIAICDKKQSVTIASNWGFAPTGNKDGMVIHKRSGSWAHQMHVRGVFNVNGNWYVHIGNQWGVTYHPSIGRKLPLGGFVIPAELFDTWVKDSECYSRGSIKGRVFVPNFDQW